MPPAWFVLSEQLQSPFVCVHADIFQFRAVKMVPAFSQVTGTDETERQEAARGKVTEPLVVVLSR